MDLDYNEMMKLFSGKNTRQLLLEGIWGIEKESLRIAPSGKLALTPHPAEFGDKLENPHITVDFSESQLELITPPLPSIEGTHQFLSELHTIIEDSLEDELLWPLSMPGCLPDEKMIPLAKFGTDQTRREKEIYRSGLALRYGKRMQMISGIHYNFSFSDRFLDFIYEKSGRHIDRRVYKDQFYFNLAKNFLEFRWLLIYLFGASPLGTETYMQTFLSKNAGLCDKAGCRKTFGNPVKYATSLRMSRFGYENSSQNRLNVSYNSLKEYIRDLRKALATKVESYSKLGLHRNGQQIQLNGNLLQSENEYYAPVRFKQIPQKGQTMLDTLEEKGVGYLEFRIFDLDPFENTGIGLNQLYFLHVFNLFCAFEQQAEIAQSDLERFNDNAQLTALFGRNARLKLKVGQSEKKSIKDWGSQFFTKLMRIAELLDEAGNSSKFQKSVWLQLSKLADPENLPSSEIVRSMEENRTDYNGFGLCRALKHSETMLFNKAKAS